MHELKGLGLTLDWKNNIKEDSLAMPRNNEIITQKKFNKIQLD
jgi:hypothetical protein